MQSHMILFRSAMTRSGEMNRRGRSAPAVAIFEGIALATAAILAAPVLNLFG